MDGQVQRTLVIPPPPSEPSKEVPPTVFDLVAPAYHVTVLFAYAPPNPTNAALLHALTATLPRFPLLTARHPSQPDHRRPFLLTGKGGAGALVVEAAVSSPLADHLPLAPSRDLERLHPPVDGATPHVLVLQINRFACGGLVIASSAHHQAADGYSMSTFFHAWADAARAGASGAPPVVDRPPVPYGPGSVVPRRPPRCEFEHRGAEFLPRDDAARRPPPARVHPSEIANLLLHFTGELVADLKARAQSKYTTFETVSAHLWRKITAARGRADAPARTALNVTVNGRARLGPDSLPGGFFGNAVLTASAGTGARLPRRRGGAGPGGRPRAGPASFVDFGALRGGEELEPAVGDEDNVLLPDVAADSWLHLELHRLDFGCGGRLVGILPAHSPLDGVVVLIPGLGKEGGVDVFVSLWHKHAEVLRGIAYAMD
ncbi:hypothetical protein PAHAL_3G020100 [Panicum hallii]|uniref:Transferase family protein n=1 Tax=Panicum hallii TaxID=206008 RepID=A0A2S3H613_9POAL|nr:hypothetical protein PAHAL_3G020100 [Panicum hallii]